MWRRGVVVRFEVQPRQVPGRTEEDHINISHYTLSPIRDLNRKLQSKKRIINLSSLFILNIDLFINHAVRSAFISQFIS